MMPHTHFKCRYLRVGLVVLIAWSLMEILYLHCAQLQASFPPIDDQQTTRSAQKIFIASTHWNTEAILQSHWNDAVVSLAKHLGPENIYISVVESGSWDNSKDALRSLQSRLEVLGTRSTIILDATTHADEIHKVPGSKGWITTPRNRTELRRIPFLATQRNRSLQPLFDLAQKGETFDKVLFLNDVIFSLQDALRLLETNDGEYAAACALDFAKPPTYYDSFALRDSEGEQPIMDTWPYFRARQSRHALKAGQPVPVRSCWNAMVFMDASAFYQKNVPLHFRGISDDLALYHLEASECCLIHVDNPITKEKGIYLNPSVRVGYHASAYEKVHEHKVWPTMSEMVLGLWKNRLLRLFTTSWFERHTVSQRLSQWMRDGTGRSEAGKHCLINEMQVLVDNGWAHV